nr:MAG TPA: tail length tape measure protein [Siphoviridae sp. ctJJg9]
MADNMIRIGADVSGVETGVAKAKKSIHSLTVSVEQGGRRISAGMKPAADGAAAAAAGFEAADKRVERSLKSMERAIQRDIAMKEAGERGTRRYYEALAAQRGIPTAALNPFLSQLDKVNGKVRAGGISIAQFNNALRQTPAQMTDIVTQLAGGQNPMLIMLQQGGQLRDMYGGFGNMYKGLSSVVTPTRLLFGSAAAAAGTLAYALYQGAEESRAFRRAVILSGEAAGVSAGQMQAAAQNAGDITGRYTEAREAVLALASSGRVAGENFESFARSIALQSEATGKSVEQLAAEYTAIADDPLKAVARFSATYKTLNADVYEQVKALQQQGREQEAVELVQRKYAAETEVMAQKVVADLGLIESAWKGIKDAAAGAWDGIKSFGREKTTEELLKEAKAQLEAMRRPGYGSDMGGSPFPAASQAQILKQESLVLALEARKAREDAEAAAAGKRQQQNKNQTEGRAAQDAIAERYATREEQRQRALRENEEARKKALDGITDAKERQAIIDKYATNERRINESYADKRKSKTEKEKFTVNRTVLSQAAQFDYAGLEKRYGLPKHLLAALSMQESRGNLNARSSVGAHGAFQFMPATARQYRVNTASIASSADGAARKMSDLLQRYKGDLDKALTAYHSGEGNVDKGRIGPVGRKYAPEVMARMNWLAGGKGEISDDPRRDFVDIPVSGYEKWHEDFNRRAADAEAKRALEVLNGNRAIGEQLKLLSDPTFSEWTLKQQADARARAEQADAQEDLRRVSERYAETAKSMLDGQKEEADQRLFEISLIGKTREEIERLTLARLWDKQIAAARREGAPPDVLAMLEQGKAEGLDTLAGMQKQQRESDNNWQAGLKGGVDEYIKSFGSMREQMENATVQTFEKMGDALAEFVATGKLDFRSLTVSILQDLSKIMIKMALFNAMKAAGESMSKSGGTWGAVGSAIVSAFGKKDGGIVQRFSNGGAVWGAGTATSDSIPAMLSNGEFVINAASTRRHRALLEAINKNRYASGGVVGGVPSPALFGAKPAGGLTVNLTVNVENGGGDTEQQVRQGVEAGMREAMRQIAKAEIADSWRIGNISHTAAKAV